MLLVTGATGHPGKAVVNGLLQKINPADIAVLVRHEAQATHVRDLGVNVQIGDSSYGDVADAISVVTNTPVTYYSPSLEEFTQALTQANVPDIYIGLFAGFSSAIRQGEFAKTSGDLEQLLGRKPSTLNEFITSHYSSN